MDEIEIDEELYTLTLFDRTGRVLAVMNGADFEVQDQPWHVLLCSGGIETMSHDTPAEAEAYRLQQVQRHRPIYQDSTRAPSRWELFRHGPPEYRPLHRQVRRLAYWLLRYSDPDG